MLLKSTFYYLLLCNMDLYWINCWFTQSTVQLVRQHWFLLTWIHSLAQTRNKRNRMYVQRYQNDPPAAEKLSAAFPCSLLEGNVEKSPSGLRALAVMQKHKYSPHHGPSPGLTHHERVREYKLYEKVSQGEAFLTF